MLWFRRPRDSAELIHLLEEGEKIARTYGHDYVGVEHVFLAFRSLPADHLIPGALAALHVDLPAFFDELEQKAKVVVARKPPPKLPLTPRLEKILSSCRQIPRLNNRPEATSFHLFYSIAYEGDSLPARLLRKHFISQNPDYGMHQINASILATYLLVPKKPTIWKMPKI